MVTWSLTKELKTFNGKRTASSINGAGSTEGQHAEECKLVLSYLLVQSLRPPHQTRYTETNRTESGEELRTHRHRGKLPEQNRRSRNELSHIWILTKELKTFNGKRTASSTNGAGSTGTHHAEE